MSYMEGRSGMMTDHGRGSHLHALGNCVQSLRLSCQMLHAGITALDHGTHDFPRLKTLLENRRHFELVAECEIHAAQGALAAEMEPRILELIEKAEGSLAKMERKQRALQSRADLIEVRMRQNVHPGHSKGNALGHMATSRAGSAGSSPAQIGNKEAIRLRSLQNKKERLITTLERLSGEITKKEETLADAQAAVSKADTIRAREKAAFQSRLRQPQARKSLAPGHKANLDLMAKRDALRARLDKAQENARKMTISAANDEVARISPPDEKLVEEVKAFLATTPPSGDKDVQMSAQALLSCLLMARSASQTKKVTVAPTSNDAVQSRQVQNSIKTLKATCKLLFAHENVGATMGKLLELLMATEGKQLYMKDLARVFPSSETRRHRLDDALRVLSDAGLVETAIEVEEELHRQGQVEGELLVRIRFKED